MPLLTFTIVSDLPISVDVNPSFVETIADTTYLNPGQPSSQIVMVSGSKFFVAQPKEEVSKAIRDALNGVS